MNRTRLAALIMAAGGALALPAVAATPAAAAAHGQVVRPAAITQCHASPVGDSELQQECWGTNETFRAYVKCTGTTSTFFSATVSVQPSGTIVFVSCPTNKFVTVGGWQHPPGGPLEQNFPN